MDDNKIKTLQQLYRLCGKMFSKSGDLAIAGNMEAYNAVHPFAKQLEALLPDIEAAMGCKPVSEIPKEVAK